MNYKSSTVFMRSQKYYKCSLKENTEVVAITVIFGHHILMRQHTLAFLVLPQ
jgi:hypothetical protein